MGGIYAAEEDVQARRPGAVADTNGTGELNAIHGDSQDSVDSVIIQYSQICGGQIGTLHERTLLVDDLVDTIVRVEVGLDVLKEGNGAVSTSTSVGTYVRF